MFLRVYKVDPNLILVKVSLKQSVAGILCNDSDSRVCAVFIM